MTTAVDGTTVWLAVTAVVVATVAFRLSFFLLFGRVEEIPDGVERVLRYVPPAVLPALVLPELLLAGGNLSVPNPKLVAGLVAAVVAWRTENIAATVAVGMAVFWVVRAAV